MNTSRPCMPRPDDQVACDPAECRRYNAVCGYGQRCVCAVSILRNIIRKCVEFNICNIKKLKVKDI